MKPTQMLDPKYYQYLCHLYHAPQLVPWSQYQPLSDWQWPITEQKKLLNLFDYNQDVVSNCAVLDLGCNTGYIPYACLQLGAKMARGLDINQHCINIAKYFCSQLQIANLETICGDMQDPHVLFDVCRDIDTVFCTVTLHYTANPAMVIKTITETKVKNIVLECTVVPDSNTIPMLYYTLFPQGNFTSVSSNNSSSVLGAIPNRKWLEILLAYHGWTLTRCDQDQEIRLDNPINWLASIAACNVRDTVYITAKRN